MKTKNINNCVKCVYWLPFINYCSYYEIYLNDNGNEKTCKLTDENKNENENRNKK